MADDSDEGNGVRGHWNVRRPWRTPRLPPLINQTEAHKILGVHKTTLDRWLKPDSGVGSAWGGFGPDRTYMVPPANINGVGPPVWVREDVERFAVELGRQRAPKRPRQEA